jgi:hypothetical protein
MSHIFQLSDEQYAKLAAYAAQHQQTPEMLFQAWVREVIHNVETSTSPGRAKQADREIQGGHEGETLNSPLFRVAGMFAIGESGWADKHDEYLAETYIENHANSQ